jgi:hypothetical protein
MMIVGGSELVRSVELGALRLVGFAMLVLLISLIAPSWDLLVRVAEIRQSMTR